MSLKVWLPFDGNLNNHGCSDVTAPTYNNLTLVSNGKIGLCYSGLAVYHLTNELLGNVWSLCAWIKADGWYSSNNIILCKNAAAGDAYLFYFSIIGGTLLRIGINNNNGIVFNYTFNTGTWYHVAATYNGSIGKLYINGELKTSSSISNTFPANMNNIGINCRSSNANGTARWIGDSSVHYINDARIYDHCLSAAEIREISLGLVLHYKLDDFQGNFGNPNLVNGSNSASTSTNTWNFSMQTGDKTNTIEYEDNLPILVITRGSVEQSGWCFLSYNSLRRNEIKTSTTYTVSFDIKSVQSGTINFTGFLLSNATNYMTKSTKVILGTVNANVWSHIILQCTTKDSFDGVTIGSQIVYMSPSTSLRATGNIMKFKNIKVEEGEIETAWCPSNSELNIDRTIVPDSSGYNHNGTITGNITLDTNTPRYSTSFSFNGTERITTTTLGADIRTLSCWCKTTKNKSTSLHMVADSFSNMCISFYQGTIIGVFGTTRSTGSKSTLGDSYKENDWNHIVVVKTDDAGARDIYCNGVKLTPASNDYWSASTGFFVGARNTSNGNPFYGLISDVRAYCTALDADAIRQLYEVSAKVDNLLNIHTFEFIEYNSITKITKTGQVKTNTIQEDSTYSAKVIKNIGIKSKNLIER